MSNNFDTSQDYQFLIKTLSTQNSPCIFKSQALKRLLVLSYNDKKQFGVNSKQILMGIHTLYQQDKEDLNINVTLLLVEVLGNAVGNIGSTAAKQHEQILVTYHLEHLINNLGHPAKPAIRKASHTCLLAFLRAYRNFNALIHAYRSYGFGNVSQLVKQKAINSFQSILILQVKCFDWRSNESIKLMQSLLTRSLDENTYVAKAASQCLVSMCKIQEIMELAGHLSVGFLHKLKFFLQESAPYMIANITALRITEIDVQVLIEAQKKKAVRSTRQTVEKLPSKTAIQQNPQPVKSKANKVQTPVTPINLPQNKINSNISSLKNQSEQTQLPNTNRINTQRRLDKVRQSTKIQKKTPVVEKQHAVVTQSKLFGSLIIQGNDAKQKVQSAQDLLYRIQSSKDHPQFKTSVKQLLPTLIKMLKDPNPKLVSICLKILQQIIQHLNPNEKSFAALLSVICEKLGDQKISIRQSVAKVIKELIKKTIKKGIWIHELIENMKKNTNPYLKEQSIGLILNIFEEATTQTGQKFLHLQIDYPLEQILDNIVIYSDDPKTKIKIKVLDCLAQVVFVSGEMHKHSESLKPKMPAVFYQMFLQKISKLLREQEKQRNFALQLQRNKQLKSQQAYTSKTPLLYQNHKQKHQQFSTTSKTDDDTGNGNDIIFRRRRRKSHKRNDSQGDLIDGGQIRRHKNPEVDPNPDPEHDFESSALFVDRHQYRRQMNSLQMANKRRASLIKKSITTQGLMDTQQTTRGNQSQMMSTISRQNRSLSQNRHRSQRNLSQKALTNHGGQQNVISSTNRINVNEKNIGIQQSSQQVFLPRLYNNNKRPIARPNQISTGTNANASSLTNRFVHRKLIPTTTVTNNNNNNQTSLAIVVNNNSYYNKQKNSSVSPTRRTTNLSTDNKAIPSGDYLARQDLTPLSQPEKQLKNIILPGLQKGSDWKVLFECTNKLRRLIEFNPECVSGKSTLHTLFMQIVSMVENLRSSVSKNALLALNELILIAKRHVDSEIDLIFDRIIKKSADTNVFISAQVQRVMSTLCVEATSHKILDKILAFKQSKSIPIKDTLVNCLHYMKDVDRIHDKQYVRIVEGFAYFLFDGNQEVRSKAKMGVFEVCTKIGDWYRALRGKINASYFKSVSEVMTSSGTYSQSQSPTLLQSPLRRKRRITYDNQQQQE